MPRERPCRHSLQAKDGRGVDTRVGRILVVARMLPWMAMTVVASVIHRSYCGCLPPCMQDVAQGMHEPIHAILRVHAYGTCLRWIAVEQ
jgi:hypothetical protein